MQQRAIVRYATENVQQTQSSGRQCRGRHARDNSVQETTGKCATHAVTDTTQHATCTGGNNATGETNHATDDMQQTTPRVQQTTIHSTCAMQRATIHTRCAMQRTACGGQQTTRNSQRAAYVDNVENTTDAMQRATDIMQPSTGDMRQTIYSKQRAKTAKQQETRSI